MEFDKPKPRKHRNWRNLASTLIGLGVAIANAWVNVDWETFQMDTKHLAPLVVSAMIAIGGHMTSINYKAV